MKPHGYIATQGPLVHTVQAFWRMVWEQHVGMIVMLTPLAENGKEKTYRYWPPVRMTEEYGPMHVTYEAERTQANFTIRRFYVRDVRRCGRGKGKGKRGCGGLEKSITSITFSLLVPLHDV